MLAGCATGPPPLAPSTGETLEFTVNINPSGHVETQWTTSAGNTYLGYYRIVINNLNPALIGSQTAITTNPDTWTDYFELNNGGWIRNDRIAPPSSQQPQQWTGAQPVTPGTIGTTSYTMEVTLPDHYLGNASQFNVSVITYIAPQSNPSDILPIDALGPPITATSPISYISFNSAISKINTMSDPLDDYATYPAQFPDLQASDYQNFDISSFTVQEQAANQ